MYQSRKAGVFPGENIYLMATSASCIRFSGGGTLGIKARSTGRNQCFPIHSGIANAATTSAFIYVLDILFDTVWIQSRASRRDSTF